MLGSLAPVNAELPKKVAELEDRMAELEPVVEDISEKFEKETA
jgi:hypothetical protein